MASLKNLEQKTEKIDWKEWTPIYGIYQANKDFKEKRPNIFDINNLLIFFGSALYQAVSIGAVLGAGTSYFLNQ